MTPRRIGLIVNPVAGMGGRPGLKGTDGADVLARARRLGATPVASGRARRALAKLAGARDRLAFIVGGGAMGASDAEACGIAPAAVIGAGEQKTSAEDTREVARALREAGVDLLLFAGGDGTARDIFDVVGGSVPMLGIPTGVKMHSAVFAASPESAGQLAGLIGAAGARRLAWRDAEIMDIDEAALREGRVSARLYGYARAPFEKLLMPSSKAAASVGDDAAVDAVAREIRAEMVEGRLYVLGCGTSLQRLKRAIGFDGTLLGVDVVVDGAAIDLDVSGDRLDELLAGGAATIVTGVTGGQGFLFGRGNQQIGATAICRVGRDNIVIMAGAAKLLALDPSVLRVDTGDPSVDHMLTGYMPVRVAPGRTMMMQVAA